MIHDGYPSDELEFTDWRKRISGFHLFCLYLIPDLPQDELTETINTVKPKLDELIGRQHYAMSSIENISKHWCAYVKHYANRYSKIIS